MMGDKNRRFAQDAPVPKPRERRQEQTMMGNKDWRFFGALGTIRFHNYNKGGRSKILWRQGLAISLKTPAAPSGSQVTRWEAGGDSDGRQGLAIPQDPRQHHPAHKLQDRGEQEIMIGDVERRTGDLSGNPAPSGSPATRRETRRDYDGRQGLPMEPGPAPSASPATKRRQEEIMMGDKDWLFLGTARKRLAILPGPPSYKKGCSRRL